LPWLKGKTYPLLIEATRTALEKIGKPWVMENVEDAPMGGIVLCGQMFGLPTFRHRRFESSHLIMCPSHAKHGQVIGHGRMLNDRGKGSLNNSSAKGAWGNQKIITVAGGQFKKADGERALGIDWMRKDELAQAIPPAYTEYIGKQLMKIIGGAA
jgi:DNA (cytosine-5)-methyltransferase 1